MIPDRPRVALVGEAPPVPGMRPFDGPSGRMLDRWAGWPAGWRATRLVGLNLFHSPVDRWSTSEARAAADALWPVLALLDGVLLAGARVARAFGLQGQPWLSWRATDPAVAVVPHPSGRNRWWNAPEDRAAARLFLSGIMVEDVRRRLVAEEHAALHVLARSSSPVTGTGWITALAREGLVEVADAPDGGVALSLSDAGRAVVAGACVLRRE